MTSGISCIPPGDERSHDADHFPQPKARDGQQEHGSGGFPGSRDVACYTDEVNIEEISSRQEFSADGIHNHE